MAKPSPTDPPLLLKIEELTPYHFAERVGERPARIAGIDGGVGLDHVEVEPGLVAAGEDVAAGRAHDAHGDRRLGVSEEVCVGIAERHDPLADHEVGAAAGNDRSQSLAIDLEYRDVGDRIFAEHLGRQVAAVRERHHHLFGVGDDVLVGEDDSAGTYDEPSAVALHQPRAFWNEEQVPGRAGRCLAPRGDVD